MLLTPRRAGWVLAVSLVAYGLTCLPGPWVPRFSMDALNYWFTGLASFSVPVALALLGRSMKSLWRKAVAFVLAGLVAPFLVMFGLFALMEAGTATASFMPLDEVVVGHSTYRLYLSNCGATCSFVLVLRREVELLHVVKFVSTEWSVSREQSAALRLSPEGRVQVMNGAYVMHTVGDP